MLVLSSAHIVKGKSMDIKQSVKKQPALNESTLLSKEITSASLVRDKIESQRWRGAN